MHFVPLLARGLLSGVLGLIGISPRCPRLDVSMRLCQPALVVLELPGLLTAQMYEGSSLKFGLSAREEADKITNKQTDVGQTRKLFSCGRDYKQPSLFDVHATFRCEPAAISIIK